MPIDPLHDQVEQSGLRKPPASDLPVILPDEQRQAGNIVSIELQAETEERLPRVVRDATRHPGCRAEARRRMDAGIDHEPVQGARIGFADRKPGRIDARVILRQLRDRSRHRLNRNVSTP